MAIDFEEGVEGPTNEQIGEISSLAELQRKQEADVEDLEKRLKTALAALRQTQEQDLPAAMLAAGMEQFKTTGGVSIGIKETLYASIPKAKRPAAVAWLLEHNQESLVKEDVVIPFDKGDHQKVGELVSLLEQAGYDQFSVNEAINTGSVKAMIREMLENGDDVPLDTFGAYFHRKAVISL